MKKIFLFITILSFSVLTFAKTRDLGVNSFIDTDGSINVAVKAFFATDKAAEKSYLPFVLYAGCDSKVKAVIERSDIVLTFKGKKYNIPSIKELRKNYKGDIFDLNYLQKTPNHILSSEMKQYHFQGNVNFFPPRNAVRTLFTEKATIDYTNGFASIIYFKNPGIKAGDTFTITITDHKDKNIKGEITLTL